MQGNPVNAKDACIKVCGHCLSRYNEEKMFVVRYSGAGEIPVPLISGKEGMIVRTRVEKEEIWTNGTGNLY